MVKSVVFGDNDKVPVIVTVDRGEKVANDPAVAVWAARLIVAVAVEVRVGKSVRLGCGVGER